MIARILAGVTVAVAALLAWGPAAPSHPGEGVPASVADSLRGGDCYATAVTFDCDNATGTCDTNTACTAQSVVSFSGTANNGISPDGDLVCCGAIGSTCSKYNPKKKLCGQG